MTELLAQLVASQIGLFASPEEKQVDLLRRLQDQGIVPREVGDLFAEVRRAGNDANHRLAGDHPTALLGLRLAWQRSVWFHPVVSRAVAQPTESVAKFVAAAKYGRGGDPDQRK